MPDPGQYKSQEELERELRAALSPRPAPEGFADRVMARLETEGAREADRKLSVVKLPVVTSGPGSAAAPSERSSGAGRTIFGTRTAARNMPWLRSGIAATMLMTVVLGGYLEHRRQEQIAGEQARRQVLLALRIAGTTLVDVRNKTDRGYFHSNTTQDEREP